MAFFDLGLSERDYNRMSLRTFIKILERKNLDEQRQDYRFAQIACILANANRDPKKKRKPYKVQDFMITKQQKQKREQTPEEIMSMVEMLNAAFGGKDTRRR